LVTATLLKWILRGENRVITLSTVQDAKGPFGNIALSLPVVISESGIEQVLKIRLNEKEENLLLDSANILKKAVESVQR